MRKPVQSEDVWDDMVDSNEDTARRPVPSVRPEFIREDADTDTMRSLQGLPASRRWQRLAMAMSAACIAVLAWGAPVVPTLLMLASVATLMMIVRRS